MGKLSVTFMVSGLHGEGELIASLLLLLTMAYTSSGSGLTDFALHCLVAACNNKSARKYKFLGKV